MLISIQYTVDHFTVSLIQISFSIFDDAALVRLSAIIISNQFVKTLKLFYFFNCNDWVSCLFVNINQNKQPQIRDNRNDMQY